MRKKETGPVTDETCAAVLLALSASVDGEASPPETLLVEQHLRSCPACRSHLAFLQLVSKALPAPPTVAMPAGLSERIAAATYARPSLWDRLVGTLRPLPVRYALGGALAAATVGVTLLPRLSTPERVAVSPAVAPPRLTEPQVSPHKPQGLPRTAPDAKRVALIAAPKPDVRVKALSLSPRLEVKPKAELPRDHKVLPPSPAVVVAPLAPPSPAPEGPRLAPAVAAAPILGSQAAEAESSSVAAPVTTVALGARPRASIGSLVDAGSEEPTPGESRTSDGKLKVTLSVTAKQMQEASSAIPSLNASGGDLPAHGRNLTIVSSPVR